MARRFKDRRVNSSFKIQITSLVDVFVILLVFLLKSYATSPVTITATKELTLPNSSSTLDPEDIVKLVVAQNGIFLEDKKIIDLKEGQLSAADIDKSDDSYLPLLFKALDEEAEKNRKIANVNETVKFEGKILMQADKNLPYELLQKVMYTSMMAGFSNVKIGVANQ